MGSESSNRKVNGHRSSVREKFMVDLFSPSVMSVRELLKKAHEMSPGCNDVDALNHYITYYRPAAERTSSPELYFHVRLAIQLRDIFESKQVQFNRSLLMDN